MFNQSRKYDDTALLTRLSALEKRVQELEKKNEYVVYESCPNYASFMNRRMAIYSWQQLFDLVFEKLNVRPVYKGETIELKSTE